MTAPVKEVRVEFDSVAYIPQEDPCYVPADFYETLKKILGSKIFFPTMITGPTGCGKTLTVEQVLAELKREVVRTNITIESDEDSLMGGFRLVNGNTVFHKGPVLMAMERGCTLLLDEYDLGSPTRMMCLQSVLEGKGYLVKRTGEWITAKPGFMVAATCNTKGMGDAEGRYIGTQILNEAALDRFPGLIETKYPTMEHEKKIIDKVCKVFGVKTDDPGIKILAKFADQTRAAAEKSVDLQQVTLSTRRLVDMVKAYAIMGDLEKAMDICISRYEPRAQAAMKTTFKALLPVADPVRKGRPAGATSDRSLEDVEPF